MTQGSGNVGLSEPEFSDALTFGAVLFFDHVGEQASVRKALFAGELEIIVPMSKQFALGAGT
jgi:hypothetical protein